MENHRVGERSQADVVLCYLDDKVDREALGEIRERLSKIDVYSISMGQESIVEAIHRPQWFNPFPRGALHGRPDAAAASVMEEHHSDGGQLAIGDDPAHFLFDFMQETNDYYFLRWWNVSSSGTLFRVSCLAGHHTCVVFGHDESEHIPSWLAFIGIEEPNGVPLLLQLLLLVDRRSAETGFAEHAGCAEQFFQYAGRTDFWVILLCGRIGWCRKCWCISPLWPLPALPSPVF